MYRARIWILRPARNTARESYASVSQGAGMFYRREFIALKNL